MVSRREALEFVERTVNNLRKTGLLYARPLGTVESPYRIVHEKVEHKRLLEMWETILEMCKNAKQKGNTIMNKTKTAGDFPTPPQLQAALDALERVNAWAQQQIDDRYSDGKWDAETDAKNDDVKLLRATLTRAIETGTRPPSSAAACACGDSFTKDAKCVNCLMMDSPGVEVVGEQDLWPIYNKETNEQRSWLDLTDFMGMLKKNNLQIIKTPPAEDAEHE